MTTTPSLPPALVQRCAEAAYSSCRASVPFGVCEQIATSILAIALPAIEAAAYERAAEEVAKWHGTAAMAIHTIRALAGAEEKKG